MHPALDVFIRIRVRAPLHADPRPAFLRAPRCGSGTARGCRSCCQPSPPFERPIRLSPKVSLPGAQPAGPCERLGSALTNAVRAADDLPVKLALALTIFDAAITAFRGPRRRTLLVVGSRRVRVAIVRTEQVCVGPGAISSRGVQPSLGIDRRRDPARSAITRQLAAPTCCQIGFGPRHALQAFPSLGWVHAHGKRARNPHVQSDWTRPPGRWGNAHESRAPAPQSKPVAPCTARLVAQDCAVGGIRAWAEHPGRRASSPPTVLPSRAVM